MRVAKNYQVEPQQLTFICSCLNIWVFNFEFRIFCLFGEIPLVRFFIINSKQILFIISNSKLL